MPPVQPVSQAGPLAGKRTATRPLPAASRRQQVVDLLRESIITGQLVAGQQLKQDQLGAQFGVSPAPIREAFRQLASEGLVEHIPNHGVFVTDVSADEFLGVLLPVRMAIESYAVPLAASQMTEETFAELERLIEAMEKGATSGDLAAINEYDVRFHELTIESAGSVHALQLWRSVQPRIRAQIYRLSPRHQNLKEIAAEHRKLLGALKRNNTAELLHEIEEHIVDSATDLLQRTDGRTTTAGTA
ncbi:MAG: GntR family transcriptional regulator [Mycobacterium sp.]|nr:GntR family transcriptional regulator [Mycobacterium sp.]